MELTLSTYCCRCKSLMRVNFPSSVVSVPVILPWSIYKYSRLVNSPISVGICLVNLLLYRLAAVTDSQFSVNLRKLQAMHNPSRIESGRSTIDCRRGCRGGVGEGVGKGVRKGVGAGVGAGYAQHIPTSSEVDDQDKLVFQCCNHSEWDQGTR
jgi:hypothetical protein